MTSSPDFTWLFVKMIAGLILVLGLALVLVRFVLPRTGFGRSRAAGWGRLIDRLPLEPRRCLYLVKITGRYFVLGATEHSVNVVTELTPSEGEKIETA